MRLLSILSVFFLLIGTTSACFDTPCHSKSAYPPSCPSGSMIRRQKMCAPPNDKMITEECCPVGYYPDPPHPGPQDYPQYG